MERRDKGADYFILVLVPFLFQVVESLYIQTRKLPFRSGIGAPIKQITGSYEITVSMFLPPEEYALLRVILSLMGDIYNPLNVLKKSNQLAELTTFINEMYHFEGNCN